MGGESSCVVKHSDDVIDCSPNVATVDINKVLSSRKNISDKDKALLRKARALVAEKKDAYFQNCEVRVVGESLDLIFKSGRADNVWIITEKEGEVIDILKRRSWSHYLCDIITGILRFASKNIYHISGFLVANGTTLGIAAGSLGGPAGSTAGGAIGAALGAASSAVVAGAAEA